MSMVESKKSVQVFQIAEIAYYLYFAVMTLAKGLGLYDGMRLYMVALCMGAVLIGCKLMLTEHTLAEWLYIAVLGGMGLVIWRNSGQTGALIYMTMIAAMKNVPVKRLFSLGLVIWAGTLVLQTILTITGVRADIFVIHDKLGLGHIIRWSLGQPHPNVLQITCLIICAFIMYLGNWKGKALIRATVIMLAANLYVFFYSVSYTGIILVFVYLFANLYLSFRKELYRAERALISLVFPVCAAFAVLGPVVFQGRLWELCNKILNTRFHIARTYLTTDPVTLFGARPSEAIPGNLQNIDSSYVFALMHYGLVFFLLLCVGYMALIHHQLKTEKHKELAITLALSVAAISEPFFVNPSFKNISLLFLGAFVFEKFGKFARKYPELILNRSFCLLPIGKKEVKVSTEAIERGKERYLRSLTENKKAILAVGLCVGVAAGILFAATVDMPERYYALRASTEQDIEERIYLDLEELPEDFDGKILNYIDKETPMHVFEGNITTMEYARGIVSSGLWGGVLAGILVSILFCLKKKRNSI